MATVEELLRARGTGTGDPRYYDSTGRPVAPTVRLAKPRAAKPRPATRAKPPRTVSRPSSSAPFNFRTATSSQFGYFVSSNRDRIERERKSKPKLSTRRLLRETLMPSKSKAFNEFAASERDKNKGLGGLVANFGREAAGFALSGGPLIQLAAEGAIYPVVRAVESGTDTLRGRRPSLRSRTRIGRAIEGHYAAAGTAVVDDYRYRYGPLLRGDGGTFLSRVYEAPLSFALDAGGAYSATGRGAGVAARGVARATPNTNLGRAMARVGDRSILAPGEINPATGLPSEGGRRYRPPRIERGYANRTSTSEPAFSDVMVHRRPYSTNLITQRIQRARDASGGQIRDRLTRWADQATVPTWRPTGRQVWDARIARISGRSSQARFDRAQVRATRELRINAEANTERMVGDLIDPVRTAARPIRNDLQARQIATLEARGVLAPRGPLGTRDQVLRAYVDVLRRNQDEARAAGANIPMSVQQLDAVAAIPESVANLRAPSGPAIQATVQQMRLLDQRLQALQTRVGAVSPQAARNAATRHELGTLGEAQWAPRQIRQVRAQARATSARARELADAGDMEGAAKLADEAAKLRVKAEEIRAAAINETQQVADLRVAQSDAADELSSALDEAASVRRTQQEAYRAAVARRAGLTRPSSSKVFTAGGRYRTAQAVLRSTDPVARAQVRATELSARSRQLRLEGRTAAAAQVEEAAHRILTAPPGWQVRSGRRVRIVGLRDGAPNPGVSPRPAKRARVADVTPTGKNPKGTSGTITTRPDASRQAAYGSSLAAQSRLWQFNSQARALRGAEAAVTGARVELARGVPAAVRQRVARARRNYREVSSRLRAAENESLGLGPPAKPELVAGGRGIYLPEHPIDPIGDGVIPGYGGGSFSGPSPSRQNTGLMAKIGNWEMDGVGLLTEHAERVARNYTGTRSPRAIQELVGTAALKTWVPADEVAAAIAEARKMGRTPPTAFASRKAADGTEEVLVHAFGSRGKLLLDSDPDRVVLINVDVLRQTLERVDNLPPGRMMDASEVESLFYGTGEDIGLGGFKRAPDVAGAEYIAISRKAAEVWREVLNNPDSVIGKWVDAPLGYWKAGLLALSPRWYVNNTVGLSLQYGLLTGWDLRAMRQAMRSPELRRSVPAEIEGMTAARDFGTEFVARHGERGGGNVLLRTVQGGYRVNNALEGFWKRSAYLSRGRKSLEREGLRTKGMSDADLARHIDEMPNTLKRQVIREVDLFIGDYRRLSRFERAAMRRLFPFWSWLRVIGRLTMTMPFRHPLRTYALHVLGQAAAAGINPDDEMRPIYRRGDLNIAGVRIPTQGANPFGTVVPFIQELTGAGGLDRGIGSSVGLVASWGRPEFQTVAQAAFGIDAFGNPLFAPPGRDGTVQGWTGDAMRIDPVTGLPTPVTQNRPWLDSALAAALPGQYNVLRTGLSAGETVYDTTSLSDLAKYRLGMIPGDQVVYPRRRESVSRPSSLGLNRVLPDRLGTGIGAGVGSFIGVRAYRENPGALERAYNDTWRRYLEAERSTRKRIAQNRARLAQRGG